MGVLEERINLLNESGLVDESGGRDLESVACVVVRETGIAREDIRLASLVTHIAAALHRKNTNEKVAPIAPEVMDDVYASSTYPEAKRVTDVLFSEMENALPKDEADFVLAHVEGLLMSLEGVSSSNDSY